MTPRKAGVDILKEAYFEEYKSLRQELIEVIKIQQQTFTLVVGIFAASLSFMAERIQKGILIYVFVIPIPLSIFALIHISLEAQHISIGRYIATVLSSKIKELIGDVISEESAKIDLWEWESWHRSAIPRNWPILKLRSLLSGIEFLILVFPSLVILIYQSSTSGISINSIEGIIFIVACILTTISLISGVFIYIYRTR